MLFAYQYHYKIDAVNNIFDGSLRRFIILVTLLNMTYTIVRMQDDMTLTKDFFKVIALGGLLISSFMMILNTKKRNMDSNLAS